MSESIRSDLRGAALSRLRTLGLSARQGRGLLLYELVPVIGVALLAGGLVGAILPQLIGPALGLTAFTAGVPARGHVDPLGLAAVLAAMALATATALLVESVANRRASAGSTIAVVPAAARARMKAARSHGNALDS